MAKNQHVVPNPNGGWDIKGAGNSRATKHTITLSKSLLVSLKTIVVKLLSMAKMDEFANVTAMVTIHSHLKVSHN